MTDTLPRAVIPSARMVAATRAALALVDTADTLITREGRASTRAWLETVRDQLCDMVVHLRAPNLDPAALEAALPLFERWIEVDRATFAGLFSEHARTSAA
jgi:hypothetical protein